MRSSEKPVRQSLISAGSISRIIGIRKDTDEDMAS